MRLILCDCKPQKKANHTMVAVLSIVGGRSNDPLYEADLSTSSSSGNPGGSASADELAYLHAFVMHSALDMVSSSMWTNNMK